MIRRAVCSLLLAAATGARAAGPFAPPAFSPRFIRPVSAAPPAAPRLEPPDAAAAAWLAARVPGLDVSRVRAVPFELVEAVVKEAAARRATYLDVLTLPELRDPSGDLYFVSEDVLRRIDRLYVTGALPVAGTTKDGRPFRMRAILIGAGQARFFYEEPAGFSFMDGRDELRIAAGGAVRGALLGPGDLGLEGLRGCGCLFVFCGCADIRRLTKSAEPGHVDVQTSAGPRRQDLGVIHPRP